MTAPMSNPVPQDAGATLATDRADEGAGLPGLQAGTLIATPTGPRPIETLRPGDTVSTADGPARGIVWIGHRTDLGTGNPAHGHPILLRGGAIAPGRPARDLIVGPGHAILLDGVLVPAALLVDDLAILTRSVDGPTAWYHLELDRHDILLAEDAPVESFVDCDSVSMFDNAAQRPDRPDAVRWTFCAPRVEDGPRLAAIRDRLAASRDKPARPGPVIRLERVSHDELEGHAVDPRAPDRPLVLEVLLDGGTIGRVRADRARPDLAEAHTGHDRIGFRFTFAARLAPDARHAILLRAVGDPAITASAMLDPVATPPPPDAEALRQILAELAAGGAGPELLARLEANLPRLRPPDISAPPATRHAVVLDEHLPAAPNETTARVVASLLRAGCAVTLAAEDLVDRGGRFLDHPGLAVAGRADYASLEDILQQRGAGAILVHVGSSATMSRYAGLIRAHCRTARLTQAIGRLGPKAVASALSGQADTLLVRGASDAAWLAAQPGAPADMRLIPPPENPAALDRLMDALASGVTPPDAAT